MIKYLVLVWIALAGGAYYFYNKMPKPVEEVIPADVDAKKWRRGRAIYRSRCTTCHNPNPDLPGSVGPKLRGVPEELLIDRLTNGKGAMPPQKEMLRFSKDLREYLK